MSLVEGVRSLWARAQSSLAELPLRIAIPMEQTDERSREALGARFIQDASYFQVELNEVFLSANRKWLTTFEPMVLVVSEFIYDREVKTVPFVVGRRLLEKHAPQGVPSGMLYTDTRVAGIHPYRGDRLNLTVLLYQVPVGNRARDLLGLVESASGVFDIATMLAPYTKLATVLFEGVAAITETDDVRPLLGQRRELELASDEINPGFHALIDLPEGQRERFTFWVVDGQLRHGDTASTSEPFRDADYLLYSLVARDRREDERLLSFFPLWERVLREATEPTPNAWESAKVNMAALHQSLMLSPDLTLDQALALSTRFQDEMKRVHDAQAAIAHLGGTSTANEPGAVPVEVRRASLDILQL
jgi:hypothetical protein